MGWGSATALFDGAVDVALKFAPVEKPYIPVDNKIIALVVKDMYTKVDWDDWDTQEESKYWPYLLEVMHDLGEIDDEDYYDYKG